MKSYFARLIDLSGPNIQNHEAHVKSTEGLIADDNDKTLDDDKLQQQQQQQQQSSQSKPLQLKMKHNSKAFSSPADNEKEMARPDTELNTSYAEKMINNDFFPIIKSTSLNAEKRETHEIISREKMSVDKRDNVLRIHYDDDDEGTYDSETRNNAKNKKPIISSIPFLTRRMTFDNNAIMNMDKTLVNGSSELLQSSSFHKLRTAVTNHDLRSKETGMDDKISVSIGTIVINVTRTNNDDIYRQQISAHTSESSHVSNTSTSRLYRYYGSLR